jgi:hypothetical protein
MTTPPHLAHRRSRLSTILRKFGIVSGIVIGGIAALLLLGCLAVVALFTYIGWESDQSTVRAEQTGAEGGRLAETIPGVTEACSSEARSGDLMTGRSVFIHVEIGTWNANTASAVAQQIGNWRAEHEATGLELRTAIVADEAYMAISSQTEENDVRIDIIERMLDLDGVGGVTLVPYQYEGSEIDVGDMSNAWLTMKLSPAPTVTSKEIEAAWAGNAPTTPVRVYPDVPHVDSRTGVPPMPQYRDGRIPVKIVPAIDLAPCERYDNPTMQQSPEPYIDPDRRLPNHRPTAP